MKTKPIDEEIINLMTATGAKVFLAATLPTDIERGAVGNCFDWCAIQAAQNPQYRYVEGIARPADSDEWILHAWLTDKNGIEAFDPTWQATDNKTGKELPMPAKYIGIVMPIREVAQFMRTTGYQGIIANRWRSPELADMALSL